MDGVFHPHGMGVVYKAEDTKVMPEVLCKALYNIRLNSDKTARLRGKSQAYLWRFCRPDLIDAKKRLAKLKEMSNKGN